MKKKKVERGFVNALAQIMGGLFSGEPKDREKKSRGMEPKKKRRLQMRKESQRINRRRARGKKWRGR